MIMDTLLGIEVVPCIQTLAHLKQTLRWPYGEGMKDTQDVLFSRRGKDL